MNKLCYVAKPREFESPKSLLTRTAHYNGYNSTYDLYKDLCIHTIKNEDDLLTQESPILKALTSECPDCATLLTNTFYLPSSQQERGHIRLTSPPDLTQPYFSYCPDCIQQENFTVFQDVKLPVCPIHNKKIIVSCPKCCSRERWQNASLDRCKCGFLRKSATTETMSLMRATALDIFKRGYSIEELNELSYTVQASTTLWTERKYPDNPKPFNFQSEFHTHIIKMVSEQLRAYPGFNLDMHLAPWNSQEGDIYPFVFEYIQSHLNLNHHCDPAVCCSTVALTDKEIRSSLTNQPPIEIQRIIKTKFIKQNRRHTYAVLYVSLDPICELIKHLNSSAPSLTIQNPLEKIELIGTTEASAILGCSCATVNWLVEHDYLKRGYKNRIRGPGHKTLIKFRSVESFGKRYILVGEISALIGVHPREVVRITNKLNILPTHQLRGPYVFTRKDIVNAMNSLRSETIKPNPQRSIIETEARAKPTKTQNRHAARQRCEICKGPHYRTDTIHQILGTSPRLIRQRFFLSGLIHPHTTERGIFCSQKDIDYMINHLQKHVSITQATKILSCSAGKLNGLLNSLEIKPSCKIKYPDNEVQHLYLRTDIEAIEHQYYLTPL